VEHFAFILEAAARQVEMFHVKHFP
jgi:hypothetical protein